MRSRALLAGAVLPLLLWGALPLVSAAAPTARTAASVDKRIDRARGAITQKRGRERVLSTTIARFGRRIAVLQGDITGLQRRQATVQADLDAKRSELLRIQDELRSERERLVRLRARLAQARGALRVRLVALYKADKPDAITVILEADGFADLLERGEFMERVSDQDKRIIRRVRKARADARATEERLDALERRQQRVTALILARRNQVAAVKGRLVQRQSGYSQVRSAKGRALASTRESRTNLEGDLRALEAEQARVTAALRAAQAPSGGGGPAVAGPVRRGSGAMIWPVNGPVVSPFGPRWGRLHAGVDIAVPAGTPIRAADSGRVVLLGPTGGYGNYTCVSHGGALSSCYAHQSSYATSMGASVRKGQVIGAVGCTGHCFGDHLHFETRVNGSPVDPMGRL